MFQGRHSYMFEGCLIRWNGSHVSPTIISLDNREKYTKFAHRQFNYGYFQVKDTYSDLLFEAEFDEVGPVVWKCFGRFLTILERLTRVLRGVQTNGKKILDLLAETITWMYISFLSAPWRDNPNSNFMGCLLRTGVFYRGVTHTNMFGSVSWTQQYNNHPTHENSDRIRPSLLATWGVDQPYAPA